MGLGLPDEGVSFSLLSFCKSVAEDLGRASKFLPHPPVTRSLVRPHRGLCRVHTPQFHGLETSSLVALSVSYQLP